MPEETDHNLELDFYTTQQRALLGPADQVEWPKQSRFPLNLTDRNVQNEILADLRSSISPLIVCGYASLDQCINFVSSAESEDIRILFGNEPFISKKDHFSIRKKQTPEAEAYWLEKGISLLLSAKIIEIIDQIRDGRVNVRFLDRSAGLHAKIYVADDAATIGSSNFTASGLRLQHEANARFTRTGDKKRHNELSLIAKNYWEQSSDYSESLISLLESLLRVVTWQEALARASGELLDGEWAQKYIQDDYLQSEALWPSQKQGIAQALYVLSNQGSVLIADATGSGKTKMGVHLIGSIQDQLLRAGRLGRGKPILICPPLVEHNWSNEVASSNVSLSIHSHGKLSHAKSGRHNPMVNALQRAQILCVDEGHNFLNNKSLRSQQLLRNIADHVVLFTATPINKGITDLLHIADLLGADNLQERTLQSFGKLLGYRTLTPDLSEDEIEDLRQEIQRFTVRRTKRELNKLIEESPGSYTTRDGALCKFPKHHALFYDLDESDRDRALAAEINALAHQLKGVSYFRKSLKMPEKLLRMGINESQYLQRRLSSAKTLAVYSIMASLRSSKAALAEHIEGTQKALQRFEIKGFTKADSGNMMGTILKLEVPRNQLSVELPDWLRESEKHRIVCQNDLKLYKRILDLLTKMSFGREREKADLLENLARKHKQVLAFDSRPITLAYLRERLSKSANDVDVLIATGDASTNRQKFIESFELGSDRSKIVGLCSDSLSEGVNLQQAGVMVHLDMPSVVRIAEQRVGRIDRMDSPHKYIQAWWPKDAEEFALSSDHRFLERYEMVDSLLGSNMPLPDQPDIREKALKAEDLVDEYERTAERGSWDGIEDAFQPVRELIEGSQPLISKKVFNHYRGIKQTVLSRVSLVKSKTAWAFFCLSAGPFDAPKWLLFPSIDQPPLLELSDVVDSLRDYLAPDTGSAEMNTASVRQLSIFIEKINEMERTFLPMKKQRALTEFEYCLREFINEATRSRSREEIDQLASLQMLFTKRNTDVSPDWDEIASKWLEIIRPIWFEKLQSPRTRPLLLSDVRSDVISQSEVLIPLVLELFADIPVVSKPEERIKACIVGVPI